MYNSLWYYGVMDDDEKEFMKWCEEMPKSFMRFMWRMWLIHVSAEDFLEGKDDGFMVKDMKTPKPYRAKKVPKITDDDIIKLAKKLNMSVASIRKVMYKKPKR